MVMERNTSFLFFTWDTNHFVLRRFEFYELKFTCNTTNETKRREREGKESGSIHLRGADVKAITVNIYE